MQYWTFENRGPKQPQTLMDAIEGVPCIVTLQGQRSMLVKKRKGTLAFAVWNGGEAGNSDAHAANYKFIRYVDPQPLRPPASVKLGDAETYRLFKFSNWNDTYWLDSSGQLHAVNQLGHTRLAENPLPHLEVTASNIFAVLKTLD